MDVVRCNLLPEAKALVTREGIYFHNMLYTSDRTIHEQRFEQVHHSEMKRSWSVPIVYDPRTADRIYLRPQGDQPLAVCKIHEKDRAIFEGCDWFDIEDLVALCMGERDAAVKQIRQMRVKHRVMQNRFIEEAQRKISEVREHCAAEKVLERETNTWDVQKQETPEAEHSHPVFKGAIERFFALLNDELSNCSDLLPSSSNEDAIALTPGENPDVKPADEEEQS